MIAFVFQIENLDVVIDENEEIEEEETKEVNPKSSSISLQPFHSPPTLPLSKPQIHPHTF